MQKSSRSLPPVGGPGRDLPTGPPALPPVLWSELCGHGWKPLSGRVHVLLSIVTAVINHLAGYKGESSGGWLRRAAPPGVPLPLGPCSCLSNLKSDPDSGWQSTWEIVPVAIALNLRKESYNQPGLSSQTYCCPLYPSPAHSLSTSH